MRLAPLVGEGARAKRGRVRGRSVFDALTPHPARALLLLRATTLSHKGRGKESFCAHLLLSRRWTHPPRPTTSTPACRSFATSPQVMDPALFRPLPGDWVVGVADVVQSTKAIAENRYKAVNMAGAAVIVAVTNAMAGRDFPFVFGGDGASFAVPADAAGAGAPGARRNRDLGEGGPRSDACGSAWCRSPTFARRASTSASPATRRRRTSRSRCSRAAAWPGPTPR